MPPPQKLWGAPQGPPPNMGGVHGFGHTAQFMPPPRQVDSYYPPPDMPPPLEKQPHQGISAYGREAPMGMHASSNVQAQPSMITQVDIYHLYFNIIKASISLFYGYNCWFIMMVEVLSNMFDYVSYS